MLPQWRLSTPISGQIFRRSVEHPLWPVPPGRQPATAPWPVLESLRFPTLPPEGKRRRDPEVQLLANRSYAVLQVNVRGSTGYTKAVMQAAKSGFAGRVHDDLIGALDHVIPAGTADMVARSLVSRLYHVRCQVLVAHGTQDVRVGLSQAQTFVDTLRVHGNEVEFLVNETERRWFINPESIIELSSAIDAFLGRRISGAPAKPMPGERETGPLLVEGSGQIFRHVRPWLPVPVDRTGVYSHR